MSKITLKSNDHIKLINYGVDLLNSNNEKKALPYFKKAYKLESNCPATIYNLGNCYYHLGMDKDAIDLLESLLNTEDAELRVGCPDQENPRPYKLDALFVLFRAKLFLTKSWKKSFPYAVQHLNLRKRGLRSGFKLNEVKYWIQYYKEEFEIKKEANQKM